MCMCSVYMHVVCDSMCSVRCVVCHVCCTCECMLLVRVCCVCAVCVLCSAHLLWKCCACEVYVRMWCACGMYLCVACALCVGICSGLRMEKHKEHRRGCAEKGRVDEDIGQTTQSAEC